MTSPRMFIHGFTGHAASWATVRHRLACDGRTPLLVGHGDNPKSVTSFQDEVDRLAALIDAPCQLIGYSMGARLALALALEYPARVRHLTLIGVHPGLDGPARRTRLSADAALAAAIEHRGIQWFADHWQSLPMWASQSDLPADVIEAQRDIRLSHRASGLATALSVLGLGRQPTLGGRLGELDMPVTLVTGEYDRKFTALAQGMVPALRRGRHHIIAGAGHNPVVERPAAIAELIELGSRQS